MAEQELTPQIFHVVQLRNGSVATAITHPSSGEESLTRSSGIIPGGIAAAVFIVCLLALYGVLWKCMASPPKRKKRKVKVRVQQRIPL
ncbi:uncharacterized protein sb:cb288 isoform X2 [Thalassophryne amazonica]|uniref:uncharacterized protein sb:cb288 isoform X2 n=1 Tax=Thalassophryne amazonica TaxID=390379 RepID=UPI001470D710|nr:uncharacterized protein sb:cb288 isoform X2 [Thalassophryne amazonica]